MNYIKKNGLLWLFFVSLTVGIVACKKHTDDPTPTQVVPSITSIAPPTAPVGSTIAINGTNLGTTPTGTTVTVGGVQATIVSVTPTQIVVTVPTGATAGPVAVTTGGQTAQSTATFTPTSSTTATPALKPVSIKKGTIFKNQVWTKDSVYLLQGMVYIPENYTLTIQAGTVIKGAGPESDPAGTGYAGSLLIERIGQVIARGTAAQPIVFTSAKAAGQRNPGDWGGVVLVGKSPVNRASTTAYPNGVRGTVAAYGEPFDNSGVLQYVRIEYAGALQPTTPATRRAGLTLIGVGAGTTIDHVQVSYSAGDGVSWFGGSVNLKNLFAYRSYNDDWTVDWGYVGNVQFGVSLRDPDVADVSGSNGFEVANYETATTDETPVAAINGLPQTAPVFTNISCFASGTTPVTTKSANGTGAYQSGIYIRRSHAIGIYNSLFYGYPEGVRLESVTSATALTSGAIDLKGNVLANVLTPVVGAGVITNDQATAYFTAATQNNQIITTANLAALLLNTSNFALTAPNFLPQTGSPLLTGAVTGGKVGGAFFTTVTYRGAFGTDNWLSGWTNLTPQTTDYDH